MEKHKQITNLFVNKGLMIFIALLIDIISFLNPALIFFELISFSIVFLLFGYYFICLFCSRCDYVFFFIGSIICSIEILLLLSLAIAIIGWFTKLFCMIAAYFILFILFFFFKITKEKSIISKSNLNLKLISPLIIPIILAFYFSFFFKYGVNIYDPFLFATNLKIFSETGNIDLTMLAYSQSEGFYSFFLYIDSYCGLNPQFWIQFSSFFHILLYGLLIWGISFKVSKDIKFLWLCQLFCFLIGFPFLSNSFQFWPSAISNIFPLAIIFLLLNRNSFNELKLFLIIFITSISCVTTHILSGLISSILIHGFVLIDKSSWRNRKRCFFLIELAVVIPFIRSIYSTNMWSLYRSFTLKYIFSLEFLIFFILISFFIRKIMMTGIELQHIFSHLPKYMDEYFFYRILPIFLVFMTVMTFLVQDLKYLIEDILIFDNSFYSLSPYEFKIPLLVFIFFVASLGIYNTIKNLQTQSDILLANSNRIFFVFLSSSLITFFLSHLINFFGIIEVFYSVRIGAIFFPFFIFPLYFNNIKISKNTYRYAQSSLLILSLVFSPIALDIVLPNSNQLIKEDDYNCAKSIINTLENKSYVITNDIRIYVLLYFLSNGSISDYSTYDLSPAINYSKVIYRKAYLNLYKTSNYYEIITNHNFSYIGVHSLNLENEKIYFVFDSSQELSEEIYEYLKLIRSYKYWYLFEYIYIFSYP